MVSKSTGRQSTGRPKREKCERKSNKEFNLEAVGFRTHEASLLQVLHTSGHAEFMALIGLTQFLGLPWTHIHVELATEFLKNYRKNQSSRISLSSSVRSKKITLTKKLIASTFQLPCVGYKHKNRQVGKKAVSSLFDPVTARQNGYYIRDCKDPAYFDRLEALNRLICFKSPGHLISAVLVDMVIHAAVQPVDWAGLLQFSLMKELDRVTSSLRQPPCTLVGVHIFLILSNLKMVTTEDTLAVESFPYLSLDGYSTANSVASDSCPSSARSSLPGSPRSVNPGLRLAEILGLGKEVQQPSTSSSPDSSQVGSSLVNVIDAKKRGKGSSTVESGSVSTPRRDIPSLATHIGGQSSSTVPSGSIRIAKRDIPSLAINIGGQKSSTVPSEPCKSNTKSRQFHFSLVAGVRFHLKRVLQCFQPNGSDP